MSGRIPADIARAAFDVIIIGAGINGAGVARDAAMRGLRVLLLDKNDLASGTTAWSTRLIHGGLRYLEHGEVGLVRESLRERERLFHIAPHLVRPLPMLIPLYEGARRGPLTIRAGMLAYDVLSFDKTLARHRMLSRDETLRRAPGLKAEGLRGAALYHDAQVEYAERLVLENALSAREHGALVLTYARVERLLTEGNSVRGVEFTDMLEGGAHTAHAPFVFNVAGPWVDETLARLDAAARTPRLIGGTKGSHIVVAPFASAPAVALYVEAGADARPFFIIPWNKLYLIGTTDRRYEGDLDCVTADDAEIDYLLAETNRVIPAARLTRASILYTYSGIRPLAYSDDGNEKRITRRHFIHDHAPRLEGLLSIAGGKLTTYRQLAEQAVNLLFKKLGRASPRCATAQTPLPGALGPGAEEFQTFGDRFKEESRLPAVVNERLLRVYGGRASLLLKLASESPELGEVLSDDSAAIGAEVLLSFQHELAQTLGDCLLRRTMVGLNAGVGQGVDEAAAAIARKYLQWTEERAAREVAAYRAYVKRFHPRGVAD
ncbi:MAG: glycerol-3-phosphate dehydrogenase [Blastocatellia bacterium]|jgi:glycerol-3-phosphate dehydrogenase|nr:glycerol-3-phosphate dehydrogenase [Blastocatellia bacterium]